MNEHPKRAAATFSTVSVLLAVLLAATMISAAPGAPIIVLNHSFETLPLADGDWVGDVAQWDYTVGNISGRQNSNDVKYANTSAVGGVDQNLPATADGLHFAWIGSPLGNSSGHPGYVSQTLSDTVQADTRYTLRVAVGKPLNESNLSPFSVELMIGGVPKGTSAPATPGPGEFVDNWVIYDAEPGDVGSSIGIRLLGWNSGASYSQVNFDNVRLDADLSQAQPPTYIVQPISATSNSIDTWGFGPANSSRDGSGLSFPLLTGDAVPAAYPAHGNNPVNNMWLSGDGDGNSGNTSITFQLADLGDPAFSLTGFHLWNSNGFWDGVTLPDRGAQSANVSVSADGLTWSTPVAYSFAPGTGLADYTGADYLLSAANIRFVKFDNVLNFSNAYGNYVGLSEVRFVAAAVPEPSTWTLCVAALMATGILARRRRRR